MMWSKGGTVMPAQAPLPKRPIRPRSPISARAVSRGSLGLERSDPRFDQQASSYPHVGDPTHTGVDPEHASSSYSFSAAAPGLHSSANKLDNFFQSPTTFCGVPSYVSGRIFSADLNRVQREDARAFESLNFDQASSHRANGCAFTSPSQEPHDSMLLPPLSYLLGGAGLPPLRQQQPNLRTEGTKSTWPHEGLPDHGCMQPGCACVIYDKWGVSGNVELPPYSLPSLQHGSKHNQPLKKRGAWSEGSICKDNGRKNQVKRGSDDISSNLGGFCRERCARPATVEMQDSADCKADRLSSLHNNPGARPQAPPPTMMSISTTLTSTPMESGNVALRGAKGGVLCEVKSCFTQPRYAEKGANRPRFCGLHKAPGMVNVVSRRCSRQGCTKVPHFGNNRERPMYCGEHRLEGMVNVANRRCEGPGCQRQPTYGFEGDRRPRFCSTHKHPGMYDVIARRCEVKCCMVRAAFNFRGNKTLRFCATHKLEGMENLKSKRCEVDGCKKYRVYGFDGDTALCCASHKRPGMVDVRSSRCESTGCFRHPSFGWDWQKKRRFCGKHKLTGMIDVRSRNQPQCKEANCKDLPIFGFEGDRKPTRCLQHREGGMVDIRSRCCHNSRCTKVPKFCFPGELQARFCATHSKEGMQRFQGAVTAYGSI